MSNLSKYSFLNSGCIIMINRTIGYFLFIAILVTLTTTIQLTNGNIINTEPLTVDMQKQYSMKVLLIPLDSRPPCTQFVQQLGSLANINIILPPENLLDNYKTPASKEALRTWLRENAQSADAAIISADMLIHGGLLASRLSLGTDDDTTNVINLFYEIHLQNPKLQLYIFNIIPRLLIADNDPNVPYQKDMLTYSVLKDQITQFENPLDIKRLAAIEKKLPREVIEKYNNLYQSNTKVNTALMDMVDQGVISCLVIGQDDGQPFGLPNLTKKRLQHYLQQKPNLANKIYITRGTDEVALTMLGHLEALRANYQPKIFVTYSHSAASQIVMPFMPHSVDATVNEKIQMMNGTLVDSPEKADYILFVHIGTRKNLHGSTLDTAAKSIQQYIAQGYKVAIVDLTEDFYGSETLYPALVRNKIDITKLIAYAGWNTTSNSIGTAVTQATIFTNSVQTKHFSKMPELYKENLEFLSARILDDWYYQKEVQPSINTKLKTAKIDSYNLHANHESTNRLINYFMNSKAQEFFRQELYNHPIAIPSTNGNITVLITDLNLEAHLPWDRTFEIWLKPTLTFSKTVN